MPSVKFIAVDGTEQEVHVAAGTNVMQAARNNDIAGIEGECGGACACATCHCYVDASWIGKVEPASAAEKGMLECVIDPEPGSRLGCQITITQALDGLVVRLPKSQY
ncbi:MAG: 2Fe-2S iron-sulfur cluster-binding protein [Spongiibacteraceae bacterium]